MSKTVFATLALDATVACAGPAIAENMKAPLDGKSGMPPNTGSATLTDAKARTSSLAATTSTSTPQPNPGGEIRGQVFFV